MVSIGDNEDIGFIWKPDSQVRGVNDFVLEKTGNEADAVITQEIEPEGNCVTNVPNHTRKVVKPDDEKLKHQRSVKLTDSENDFILMLMIAMGTKNAAEAIRRCVRGMQEEHEEEVMRMAKKKERIGTP